MSSAAGFSLRIRIVKAGEMVLGPGRAELLGHIGEAGSIAAAGRRMKMSYKRAWALVEAMNATFPTPLVAAVKGGAGGGGAKLTARGVAVLAAYRTLQQAAEVAGVAALTELDTALTVPPRRKSG